MPAPSSQEHCPICPFGEVEPSAEAADFEYPTVITHLENLAGGQEAAARDPRGPNPYDMDSARVMAARACAACIFVGQCSVFGYARAIDGSGVLLREKPTRE